MRSVSPIARAAWRLTRGPHLGALTALVAARYGDRVLLEDLGETPGALGRRTWSAAELDADVAALAGGVAAAGLPLGPTLVLGENRLDLLVTTLALLRAGRVAVPVNARLTDAELAAVASAAGVAGAIGDAAARAGLPTAAIRRGPPLPPFEGDPHAVALTLTTSGTTGLPKAATLTSAGLLGPVGWLATLPFGRVRGPRGGRDRVLSAAPLAHVMGLAIGLGALSAGVHWLHLPRFDARAALAAIATRRPNVFVGVPTTYADLEAAGADDYDLSAVQAWISGADRMPEDRALRFQRRGAAVVLGGRPLGDAAFVDLYGMVELSGPAALRVFLPGTGRLAARSPHRLLPGFSVRAVDADGRALRYGAIGELAFRGPGVLRGYRGGRGGPDADGWFCSGDYGRVWPGGWFTLAGRRHDRLKVGGFSVFPAEVEAELAGAPGVVEIAIVGVPDPRSGERLVAVVVADATFDTAAFLAWARERVAGYRRPTAVVRVEALPRGPNGKIDRAAATAKAVGNTPGAPP